jgi:transcriptional regulator with XRE-family HTH domain
MTGLMQIHEIRLMNARNLLKESGLSRADFAEKTGISYNLISQYIGKNPTKNIGDETAIKIEEAFGKPKGYLDQAMLFHLTPITRNQVMLNRAVLKSPQLNLEVVTQKPPM